MTQVDQSDDLCLGPIMSAFVNTILTQEKSRLFQSISNFGSPLHLVFPSEVLTNVEGMRSALDRYGLTSAIYYGSKVNKSPGLMKAALDAGTGIDVSSVYELRDAVSVGAKGPYVVATGPAKTAQFHDELIAIGALISIDSPEELADLSKQLATNGKPQPILLRLRPKGHEKSRFGMPAERLRESLSIIAADRRMRFDGIHFHVSGYRWQDRAAAFEEAIGLITHAKSAGHSPRVVDIGGGLPVQYLSETVWTKYLHDQKPQNYRTGELPRSFYPYGSSQCAGAWLCSFLDARLSTGEAVADSLRRLSLTLALEPGRSLVDQAAISAFQITRVKRLDSGESVIFVEGSSFSACETWFASEFMIDPILLPSDNRERATGNFRAYVAGHSCLDEDVLTNRWLSFAFAPEAGDILVWANTAGYQMDLLENEFHRHPMPKRVCATKNAAGELSIYPDI